MYVKLLVLVIAVCMQCLFSTGQRQWVDPQTSAQEMRNPYTWYSPYYQAAGEAYSKYFQNAQEIRNQLWQQAYATGAFDGGYGTGGYGSGGYRNGGSRQKYYPSVPQYWG